MIAACPVCGESDRSVIRQAPAPVNIMTSLSGDGSDRAFADFRLVGCPACGHLYNDQFDEVFVDAMYRAAPLTNVPVHPTMLDRLRSLTDWLALEPGGAPTIIEIGSGSGHLARILAAVAAAVTVYEPNRSLTAEMLPESNIALVNGLFPLTGRVAPADLIVCRQVLEHVADPLALLRAVAAALKPGGRAYIEVPSGEFVDRNAAFPDLHLQHVQYFSLPGLIRLARRAGLHPCRHQWIKDGHDVGVLFSANPAEAIETPPQPPSDPASLRARLAQRIQDERDKIAATPGRLALYGATSHGQAYLNAVNATERFALVFDDNDGLADGWGLFDATAAVSIARPNDAALQACAAIVICAYLHTAAIAARLRERGYQGPLLTLFQQ